MESSGVTVVIAAEPSSACKIQEYYHHQHTAKLTRPDMAGNFRYIPEEQKKLVLTMSLRGMKNREIEAATGIKTRTIRRLISLWKSTGQVVKHPLETGRPRELTSLEVSVRLCYHHFVSETHQIHFSISRVLSSRVLIYMYPNYNKPYLLPIMLMLMQRLSLVHCIDVDLQGKRYILANLYPFLLTDCVTVTQPARERDEEQRARYQADIGENYPPEMLVFLDESACNRMTGRRDKGWAPIEKRARRHDYFVRGQRWI